MSFARVVMAIEVIGGVLVAIGAFLFASEGARGVAVAMLAIGALVMGPGAIAYILGSKRFRQAEPDPRPPPGAAMPPPPAA